MELAKQVTSLEISKKLTELGFEGKYFFVWYRGGVHMKKIPGMRLLPKYMCGYIPAYTASELMEYLPEASYGEQFNMGKRDGKYYAGYFCVDDDGFGEPSNINKDFESETLADALGQMLIYLLSNKLIDGNILGKK